MRTSHGRMIIRPRVARAVARVLAAVAVSTAVPGCLGCRHASSQAVHPYTLSRAIGVSGTGSGQFRGPSDVAVDRDGCLYVVDEGNRRVQHFDASGAWKGTWNQGIGPNGSDVEPLIEPRGIAVSSEGRVYVAGGLPDGVSVFTASGKPVAGWADDGLLGASDVVPGAGGAVYVTDTGHSRVREYDGARHTLSRTWGGPGGAAGEFSRPTYLAVAGTGDVYVSDSGNGRIQVFSRDGRHTLQWGKHGTGDGEFTDPRGIAVDTRGIVYVADASRVQRFDATGHFIDSWQLGTQAAGGIAVGPGGEVYVADRVRDHVLRFTPSVGLQGGPPGGPVTGPTDRGKRALGRDHGG
jgi:tripartite motif-containing protein 71